MPSRSGKPCLTPGCRVVVVGAPRCERHTVERPSSNARGYGADWQRLRARHLARHPLCVVCESEGKAVKATDVDHIKAHRGNEALRLDPGNLAGLCHSHHSVKTCATDGGFGRD